VSDEDRTYTCGLHGETFPAISQSEAERRGYTEEQMGCHMCTRELLDGPDPEAMTGDERATEFRKWVDRPLTTSTNLLFKRLEALVGRGIWTHEYTHPEGLIEEARTRRHPDDLGAHAIKTAADAMRGYAEGGFEAAEVTDKLIVVIAEGDD
jgi:hypothetical protein